MKFTEEERLEAFRQCYALSRAIAARARQQQGEHPVTYGPPMDRDNWQPLDYLFEGIRRGLAEDGLKVTWGEIRDAYEAAAAPAANREGQSRSNWVRDLRAMAQRRQGAGVGDPDSQG